MGIGNYAFALQYGLCMAIAQLVIVFQFIGIDKNKKLTLGIILASSFVASFVEFAIYASGMPENTTLEYWSASIIHSVSTMILFAVLAINSSEYLPRNFIICTIYLDVVTVLVNGVYYAAIEPMLRAGGLVAVHTEYYAANCIQDEWNFLSTYLSLIAIIVLGMLFNKRIKQLLLKIPDVICLIIFVISFISYVAGLVSYGKQLGEISNSDSYKWHTAVDLNMLLVIAGCGIVVAIVMFVMTTRRSQVVQEVERDLQYNYYANITNVYNEVRHIRHDLANHMMAMNSSSDEKGQKYGASLTNHIDELEDVVRNCKGWESLHSHVLSARERYELDCFASHVARRAKGHVSDYQTVSSDQNERIRVIVDVPSKAKLFRLKRDKMSSVAKLIVHAHNGKMNWQTDAKTLNIDIDLPLQNGGEING